MQTRIELIHASAASMEPLDDASVDLVVTSPPYPMIEMWDEAFARQDESVREALDSGRGGIAFERMHRLLDRAWEELFRLLKPGGIACINVGDATRSIAGDFRLYPNHARIISHLLEIGFAMLPDILWRKPTNAPNKFLGSGMLPVGAYVTYEHEYILIARKGERRLLAGNADKQRRHRSAFFWEERNTWFSDIWFDIKGTQQQLGEEAVRQRSGAFPFELAHRLVCMYSFEQDRILDPFVGTGTALAAAAATGRNGIGVEIDAPLLAAAHRQLASIRDFANRYNRERLRAHAEFIARRQAENGPLKHASQHHGFPVMTAQERGMLIRELLAVDSAGEKTLDLLYSDVPLQ